MKQALGWFFAIVVLMWVLGCAGILAAPIELAFFVLIGWVFFLRQTLPFVHMNWGDVALGGAAVVEFVVGSHIFLKSILSRPKRLTTPTGEIGNQRDKVVLTWPFRCTLAISVIVLLAFAAGTAVVGMAHQAIWLATSKQRLLTTGGQAARRSASINNLRTDSIGIMNYQEVHGAFPAGTACDDHGTALHGWMTRILPFIEEGTIYSKIDHKAPWTAPQNVPNFQHELTVFVNPGSYGDSTDPTTKLGLSHYAANLRVIGPEAPIKIREITDGTSKTLLGGEVNANFKPWGHPASFRDPVDGLNNSPNSFGAPWAGGIVNMGFCDGSVRGITEDIDPQVLKALSTPTGGEDLSKFPSD